MIRNYIQKHKIFFIIISIAAIAHIGTFFTLKTLSVKFPNALHSSFPITGGGFDSLQYATLAQNIIDYGIFSLEPKIDGNPETFRTPGYPFFVAIIEYFTGTIDAVPFFQIVLLMLSAFLIYTIAITISPDYRNIGLIAVGLFVFDPSLFLSTQFIATECLYVTFLLASIYFLIKQAGSERVNYALAGIFYSLSAYIRPGGLYMAIPIGIWIAWRLFKNPNRKDILRYAGIFFLISFLLIYPWVARNGAKTGVYAFSSLDSYGSLNFNLPLYLSYKYEYKRSIEDIRADLHRQIGNISDEEQMDLKNRPLIKDVVWRTLKPNLFSYSIFHVGKSINFFFSPSLKHSIGSLKGFWEGQPQEPWRPEMSLANSLLDGRFMDVLSIFYRNILSIPESLFLLVMFVGGIYWYWNNMLKTDSVKLLFLMIFFLALLTSILSNHRYRVPVLPLMYIAGLAGTSLVIKKIKNKSRAIGNEN